jgi:hypothetical protein
MTFTPNAVAEKGERIYRDKFKHDLEQRENGKFVAVDVDSEEVFVDSTPEGALQKASRPSGAFHLLRIGSPGVFRVSYAGKERGDWIQ